MSVTNSVLKKETSAVSPTSLEAMESLAQSTYRLPGHPLVAPREVEWVRNTDGTPLIDHRGLPITVDRILATKPLRGELSSRPGPGNRKLTYLSGEGVTRTLNDIFGFDGWNLDIKNTQREECDKDDQGRFHVAYTATVRLTHRNSGAYKEDCGAGDAVDRSMGTAVANALKASITDAMKRAARHFGDKLGNSLYQGKNINSAPNTLKEALDQYDIERSKTKFGFPKDNVVPTKCISELAETMGLSVSTVPTSTVKASSGYRTNPLPPKANQPPVPAFNATPASVNATKPIVSQTPSGHGVTKKIGTGMALGTKQPPPTPTQGLQSSTLFQLSTFAAGSKNARMAVENVTYDENVPPIDFDALDAARPSTSSGIALSNIGKRKFETTGNHNQQARTMPNLNPYAPS